MMFTRVKTLFSDRARLVSKTDLDRLRLQSILRFGVVAQTALCGKSFAVTAIRSYLFDDAAFVSRQLSDASTEIALIAGDGATDGEAALAVSRVIPPDRVRERFTHCLPEHWFALVRGEVLAPVASASEDFTGWFASQYTLAMQLSGQAMDGDFRLHAPSLRARLARPFEYRLFLSPDQHFALEIERYEDGGCLVYATVYLTSRDIESVSQLDRARAPVYLASRQDAPQQDVQAAEPSDLLACDTALTLRLLEEAAKNRIKLSDLLRKILGLTPDTAESVFIPFSLTDAQYAELAERFQIPATDQTALRAAALADLTHFAGLRPEAG